LLSKWVGDTERAIAGLDEARRRDGILLFDEADSLLFDQRQARQLGGGPSQRIADMAGPASLAGVVAATNHPDNLDPATLRRFVFKLKLKPLGPNGWSAPFASAGIDRQRHHRPAQPDAGDFAVVA
jgi:SpoVK/Ycf46/Vps4 family AAA+-type ATPase